MKLGGFVWGGAAILAAIGGWAFWLEGIDELTDRSDRVVERVDQRVDMTVARVDRIVERADRRIERVDRAIEHAVDRPNPHFTREMERLQSAIEAGDISHGEAIDRAIEASIDGGRGPSTARSEPADEAAAAGAIFAEARTELEVAESEIRQLRDDGKISMETYSDTLAALARAEARIDEAERGRTE